MAYNSDNQENEYFKSLLRFRFTKKIKYSFKSWSIL